MIWKRPEVFRIWGHNMSRLADKYGLTIAVTGSEGEVSRNLANEFSMCYHEWPNSPLGEKANQRLKFAGALNPDFVWLMGSDDIFTEKTVEYYLKKINQGYDEIASLDLYYYHYGDVIYSHGYQGKRLGEPIAPGRMLSARVLDHYGWEMWNSSENKFLDGHVRNRVDQLDIKRHYFKHVEQGTCMMDIKTNENMTPYKLRSNYEKVSNKILKDFHHTGS